MLNKYRNIKIAMLIVLFLQLFFVSIPIVSADNSYGLDDANSIAGLSTGEDPSSASNSISLGVGKILGAVLGFLGVVFLILIVVGGLMWMTSAGNTQSVERAKKLLIAAVIGLIVVLAAYAVTAYIGDTVA